MSSQLRPLVWTSCSDVGTEPCVKYPSAILASISTLNREAAALPGSGHVQGFGCRSRQWRRISCLTCWRSGRFWWCRASGGHQAWGLGNAYPSHRQWIRSVWSMWQRNHRLLGVCAHCKRGIWWLRRGRGLPFWSRRWDRHHRFGLLRRTIWCRGSSTDGKCKYPSQRHRNRYIHRGHGPSNACWDRKELWGPKM